MSQSIHEAYSRTGEAWQRGPALVYDRLAEVLVASAPVPVQGRRMLDLGAGTGAASRALAAAGAQVVAVDAAYGMLAVDRVRRPPAVVGDAVALGLRSDSLDGVVAAFSLNHVSDPAGALRECGRVCRPGSPLVVSAYAEDDTHPVKAAVEAAAREHGWEPQEWYGELRKRVMPLLATPDRAAAVARGAGLAAEVALVRVPFPDLTAADLVAWRLGMAQLAPFALARPPSERAAIEARAVELLGSAVPPLVRSIVVMTAVS